MEASGLLIYIHCTLDKGQLQRNQCNLIFLNMKDAMYK